MLLREIKPEDNAQIEAIMRSCFIEFDLPFVGSSIEDDEVTQMFEGFQEERSVYFVVEENNAIVGGGGIKQLSGATEDICELQKMYFKPEARGRGFGRLVFEACMEAAKKFDYKTCYLESASPLKTAIKLYERNGFEHLNQPMGNTGHVICGVWMAKSIV